MNTKVKWLWMLVAVMFFAYNQTACTAQKVKKSKKDKSSTEETTTKETATTVSNTPVETNERGCPMYGADKNETLKNYSLFNEYYKTGNYTEALPYWKIVYKEAPGLRETTYFAGEKMYRSFLDNATTEAQKKAYLDTIFMIYDKRGECYGKEYYYTGKKGLDLMQYFPETTEKQQFDYFEKSIETGGSNAPYGILYPYFVMIMKKYNDKALNFEQLTAKYEQIAEIARDNIEGDSKYASYYEESLDKMDDYYTQLADAVSDANARNSVRDCASAKEYYGAKYREDPNDIKAMTTLYKAMKKYKCYSDPLFLEIANKLNNIEPTVGLTRFIAKAYASKGDYSQAIGFYSKAIDLEGDPCNKADIKLTIARMYQIQKDYSKARSVANEAADLCPDSGAPYLLIGELYAASGSLCGPGTGWDSQVVIWPAMDMWAKAKRDPDVAGKAQELINKYSAYLPEKKEAFLKGISQGDSYQVGCWIGTSTTVRLK